MGGTTGSAPGKQVRKARLWHFATIGLVLIFAVWLRVYRIGEPIGGFHAFNEGFYTHIAMLDAARGPFEWLTAPIDLNNPPLFTLIVTILFRMFGVSVIAARMVSVVSGLLVAALTFELGRVLYSKRHGAIAAMVVLLMPGAVIVGRNIQVDMLEVALSLAAVVLYVHAMKGGERERRYGIAAGVMLGLALLTKLPAVLAVPAVAICETAASKGLRWLKKPRAAWAIGATVLLVAPWYAYRAITSAGFSASQSSLMDVAEWPVADIVRRLFWTEPFWMMGLAACIAVVAGVIAVAARWRRSDLLVVLEILTVAVFVFFYHFHSYYWAPAFPFLALLAARGVDFVSFGSHRLRVAVTATLLVAVALSATVTMAGHKWGHWSPATLRSQVTGANRGAVLDVEQPMYDSSFGPVVQVYLPAGTYIRQGDPLPKGTTRVLELRAAAPETPTEALMRFRWVRVVVLGYAIGQWPPNFNFFENSPWQFEKVGPAWRFGLTADTVRVGISLTERPATP